MAERVKLIMPNGKDEIEVWDSEVEYFESKNLVIILIGHRNHPEVIGCLLYTSDAADE